MYVYTNDFHNTEARSRFDRDTLIRALWIYEQDAPHVGAKVRRLVRVARRISRSLCGVDGCTCAMTELGERPLRITFARSEGD